MMSNITGRIDEVILSGLIVGNGLQQIINEACSVTGIEATLFDLGGNVLVSSLCQDSSYTVPAAHLIHNDERVSIMLDTKKPVILDDPSGSGRRQSFCPIIKRGSLVGISSVSYDPGAGDERACTAAKRFAQLFVYLRGDGDDTPLSAGSHLEAGFARELLMHGEDISNSILCELFSRGTGSPLRFAPAFAIAAMSVGKATSPNEAALADAERTVHRNIPSSFHLICDGLLLIFLYGIGEKDLSEGGRVFLPLVHIAQQHGLCCGVSPAFRDLADRKGHKLQAVQALLLGLSAGSGTWVFPASSMYSDILISGAVRHVGLSILELSEVRLLAKHDAVNGSEYLETLERYLCCGNVLSFAAASMFLDRGTLKYRLQKIKDILHMDFDDPDDALRLRLGIAVHRLSHLPDT